MLERPLVCYTRLFLPFGVIKLGAIADRKGSKISLQSVANVRYGSCPFNAPCTISNGPIASRACQHARNEINKVVERGNACRGSQEKTFGCESVAGENASLPYWLSSKLA